MIKILFIKKQDGKKFVIHSQNKLLFFTQKEKYPFCFLRKIKFNKKRKRNNREEKNQKLYLYFH